MTDAGHNRVFVPNEAKGARGLSGTIKGLGIGTSGIAITHDGRVAGFRNQVVSIVDVETVRPQTIAVGGSPAGIGMPPP